MKRRAWTSRDIRTLKRLAGKKTRAANIARSLRRTENATRQKAFSLVFRWKRARGGCDGPTKRSGPVA